MSDEVELEAFWSFDATIVGVQHYEGAVDELAAVLLEREPDNEIDPNAVRVVDSNGQHLGNLKSTLVYHLARLIDDGEILRLEGWVAQRRPSDSSITMRLVAYGRPENKAYAAGQLAVLTQPGVGVYGGVSVHCPQFEVVCRRDISDELVHFNPGVTTLAAELMPRGATNDELQVVCEDVIISRGFMSGNKEDHGVGVMTLGLPLAFAHNIEMAARRGDICLDFRKVRVQNGRCWLEAKAHCSAPSGFWLDANGRKVEFELLLDLLRDNPGKSMMGDVRSMLQLSKQCFAEEVDSTPWSLDMMIHAVYLRRFSYVDEW